MKLNFRKIASVLATAVMIGSTVGTALASTYPTPFVSGGSADSAIVVTSGDHLGASVDVLAAVSLQRDLDARVTSTSTTTSTASGGDEVKITKGATQLTLVVSGLNDVWGTAIGSSDLKTILADGTFYNKQNTAYKYTQKIDIGNFSFAQFSDSDYNNRVPELGFQINANTQVANYTLTFTTSPQATTGADLTDFENKNVQILGKSYFILDFKNSTAKITLLDSANSDTVTEGETKTVTVGDESYATSIHFVGSDEVILTVNGVNTEKLSATGTTYGNTYKLPDGTYVGIRNINYNAKTGTLSSVDFSIGAGKLEVTSGSNVKINDKQILDLTGYITLSQSSTTKTDWQKLVIQWKIQDEAFLTPGKELVMPGFGAFKYIMDNTTFPDNEETKVVYSSNDVVEIKAPVKSGALSLPIMYIDTTTGNITGIGKSATQKVATGWNMNQMIYNATSSSVSQYEGFVASWAGTKDSESYYLRATVTYDADGVRNLTTITNKITGDTLCEDIDPAINPTCTIGNVVLTINKVHYTAGGDRIVNMTINSGGAYNKLYTMDGLLIYLPWTNSTNGSVMNTAGTRTLVVDETTYAFPNATTMGYVANSQTNWSNGQIGPIRLINSTGSAGETIYRTTYALRLSEADKDGTLDQRQFNLTLGSSGTTTFKTSVTNVVGAGTGYETAVSSKLWQYYVVSQLATKILWDKTNSDQYQATIDYHKGQVYANVYVAAPAVTVGGGGTVVSGGDILIVEDTDVSTVSGKNLIVVGGSCINAAAAKILESDVPICGAAWVEKTKADNGKYIIKTVTSPYNAAKVAVLVAGYSPEDTKMGADALKAGADTTVGTEKLGPAAA